MPLKPQRKKSKFKVGDSIVIIRALDRIFCKVYKIKKAEFNGLKMDYTFIDEADSLSKS